MNTYQKSIVHESRWVPGSFGSVITQDKDWETSHENNVLAKKDMGQRENILSESQPLVGNVHRYRKQEKQLKQGIESLESWSTRSYRRPNIR